MSLPDVSDALTEWLEEYTVKNIVHETTNFESTDVKVTRQIDAVVQPADKTALSKGQKIDWAKAYILIHTPDSITNNEYIVYVGEDYKIISVTPWGAAGYTQAVGEQTKQAAL